MVFNALKYVETLQEAGIPEGHAKAQILVLQEVIESDLATKQDIIGVTREIEQVKREIEEVKRDIKRLELHVTEQVKTSELRLIVKLGSLLVVAFGVLVAFSKLNIF